MSRRKHSSETAHPPKEHQESEDLILKKARLHVERYSWHIISAAVCLAVVVLMTVAYRNRIQSEDTDSWNRFNSLPGAARGVSGEKAKEISEEIIKACNDILDNHWKSTATPWVLLKLANAQLKTGKAEDAAGNYRKLMDSYSKHLAARLAKRLYGCALEEQKKHAEAAKWFERVDESETGDFKARLYWDAGRNYERSDSSEEAVEAYREVLELVPEGPLAELSRFRLESLNSSSGKGKDAVEEEQKSVEKTEPPEPEKS